MEFIGRSRELKSLEKLYGEKSGRLEVIYGRRRVGKTTLIREFIKNKPSVYFLATTETLDINLRRFVDAIGPALGTHRPGELVTDGWLSAFKYYACNVDPSRRNVLVIDELPYLVQTDPAFPSIIQKAWDEILRDKNIMLILCGSHESMMVSSVLDHSSPLYGRRDGQIKLQPLSFIEFSEAFPSLDFEDRVRLFGVTGGVPKYMEVFEGIVPGAEGLYQKILENVLDTNALLSIEPKFLLQSDKLGRSMDFSILRTVAAGSRKLSALCTQLSVQSARLTPYLSQLIDVGYIKRVVPITENKPAASRKGLYYINDNYIDFWFKFIYPYFSYLELGDVEPVLNLVKRDLDAKHSSYVYEDVCLELLRDYCRTEFSNAAPLKFGKYWNNNEEIDLACTGIGGAGGGILLGECKFKNSPVGADVLRDLKRKYAAAPELQEYAPVYALFSKSGFAPSLADEDVVLFYGEQAFGTPAARKNYFFAGRPGAPDGEIYPDR